MLMLLRHILRVALCFTVMFSLFLVRFAVSESLPEKEKEVDQQHPLLLHVNAEQKRYTVSPYLQTLADKSHLLNIEQVTANPNSGAWSVQGDRVPNFALSDAAYWLKLQIHSDLKKPEIWWLELAFPHQDYIDYYHKQADGSFKLLQTGARRAFASRQHSYRNFLFDVHLQPGELTELYLRVDTHDGLHEQLPLILWEPTEFAFARMQETLIIGIYFGFLIVMALYNLFLYFSVKDKCYLHYVVYISSFFLWLFSYYGFSYQYFWPESPTLANNMVLMFGCLFAQAILTFTRLMLETQQVRIIDNIIKLGILALAVVELLLLLDIYAFAMQIYLAIVIPYCLFLLVISFYFLYKGVRTARYFLLAWAFLLLGLVAFALKIGGWLPPMFITEYSMQFASALEVILLSFALADRINTLNREKEQAQQQLMVEVESANRLKDQFMSTITHELLTPIHEIKMGLSLCEPKSSPGELDYIESIKESNMQMHNLVQSMIVFTEARLGSLSVNKHPFDLYSTMRRVLRSYEVNASSKLHFSFDYDPALADWIDADGEKITMVVEQLLHNAVTFTQQGRVSLSLRKHNEKMHIVVADTGIGIAEAQQTLIYQRFTQLDNSMTREHSGLGIGLSIVLDLLSLLGGRLSLESSPGNGATFTLSLPYHIAKPDQVQAMLALDADADVTVSHDEVVMIVEDNSVNRMLMKRILEQQGYSVLEAENGEQSIQCLRKNPQVRAILMDCQMPVMDGFEATKKIRLIPGFNELPIIAVTANVSHHDRLRCVENGMNDFLPKPASRQEILQILQYWLKRSQKD